jgi:osmoprotectant transport system permease protein
VTISLSGFAALAIFAATPVVRSALGHEARSITVGAKTFTESYILSRIIVGRITRETGLPTRTMDSLGSTVAFDALRAGQIDAYVDYSGTIWTMVLKHDGAGADRATVLRETERELRERYGIGVAAALGYENTYAFAMRRAAVERIGLKRLSDLAAHAGELRIASDYELFQRPEWGSFERAYGSGLFKERRSMDPSLLYEAVKADQVDMIAANSTDGRIIAYDLVALDDDKGAIPPYDAIVLVSARLMREHPDAVAALRELTGTIDVDRMRRMNAAVDQGKASPAAVAREEEPRLGK